MSTTTVIISQAERRIALARLREQEAAARRAVRRAAHILEQQRKYEDQIALLDESRKHLPDLTYVLPPFPHFSSGEHATLWVEDRKRDVIVAIERAEEHLRERIRLREARIAYCELEQAISGQVLLCRQLAHGITDFAAPLLPTRPSQTAASSTVLLACENLKAILAELTRQRDKLQRATQVKSNTKAIAGPSVVASTAEHALETWKLGEANGRQHATQRRIDDAFARAGLKSADLSAEQVESMNFVIEHGLDPMPIVDWIDLRRSQLDERANALRLLADPPEYLDEKDLALRWRDLAHNLEEVVAGQVAWQPLIEAQWTQLCQDSQAALATAYTHASVQKAIRDEGMEIDEAEGGLEIMDFGQGVWAIVESQDLGDGRIATTVDLRGEVGADPRKDSAAITEACAKLAKLKPQGPLISSHVAAQERERNLQRMNRPVRQALSARASGTAS